MKRRTVLIVAVVIAAVLAGVGAVFVLTGSGVDQPQSAPTQTETPTPTPTLLPTPRVASVVGGVANWALAPTVVIAHVGAQVGDAADGKMALTVEAPSVDGPVRAASVVVPVSPGTEYNFSARVRLQAPGQTAVEAGLEAGPEFFELPTLDAAWQKIEGTVTPDTSEITVALRVDSPVVGLDLDDVVVAGPDGANLVPNGSFEDFAPEGRLINESLVLRTASATMAVVAAEGEGTWGVRRGDAVETQGTFLGDGGVTAIPMSSLVQGYYTFELTDAAGITSTSPFAVVDGAVTTTDMRFGVGLHVEDSWYADAARYARSVGVAEARNDILWQLNELEKGVYDFDTRYADGFDRLHANGIKVLGIVNYGNKLYGSEVTPNTPEAIAAYGRYAAAIAQRFDLVGLEVFNEFNHERFNSTGCGTDPSCYMPLLQAVHDNVRAVDPEIPIVAGSTANYDAAWFDGLWRDGGLAYADAISYHPYEILSDPSALAGVIGASRDSMNTLGGGEKPIWITELGATSYPASLTVAQQADFLLKAAATAVGSGAQKFFWYDLINDSEDPNSHEGNFGLFYRPIDGVAALPPKPSAFTYALLIDQLTGRDAVGQKPLGNGVTAYEFGSGSESVIVAWANDQEATVEIPATEAIELVAADGTTISVEPVNGVASVTITAAGAFIRTHATDGT